MVIEQAEKIKEQRREMQSSLLEKKSEANKKSKREKVVPKHAISAKVLKKEIAAQKKDAGLWGYNYLNNSFIYKSINNTSFIFIFNNQRSGVRVLGLNEIRKMMEPSAVENEVSTGG